MKQWCIYLLECRDASYYTGISNTLSKRIIQHNKGTASKYTRSRRPVKLVEFFNVKDRIEASRFERRIKKLSRKRKLEFFRNEATRWSL